MHAHSFSNKVVTLVPSNISIDASIEYRMLNPLIIYNIGNIENYNNGILIESVILSSYDNLISHRATE